VGGVDKDRATCVSPAGEACVAAAMVLLPNALRSERRAGSCLGSRLLQRFSLLGLSPSTESWCSLGPPNWVQRAMVYSIALTPFSWGGGG
jgi:hypothetical protein